jgi:hypothetical protein
MIIEGIEIQVVNELTKHAEEELRNFIKTSVCFKAMYEFLSLNNDIPKNLCKYIGGYTNQPTGCNGQPLILFARLGGENAENSTWIARLPVRMNTIYFPEYIVPVRLRRSELKQIVNNVHYFVPLDSEGFMSNCSENLDMNRITTRLNSIT